MSDSTQKYEAEIDNGQGGTTEIDAKSIDVAMAKAILWAQDGDWPDDGCDIDVSVRPADDEDDDWTTRTIHIPSDAEKLDEQIESDGVVLGQRRGEYETEQVVAVLGRLYHTHPNGGAHGVHDRMDGDGVWRDSPIEATIEIDLTEAIRILLDWGYDPEKIAKKMKPYA